MAEKKKRRRILLGAAGVVIIALAATCMYLMKENLAGREEIQNLTKKCEMLQKKYAEQKHQAEELLRMKTAVEGRQRTSMAETEKAVQEKEALRTEIIGLRNAQAELNAKVTGLNQERDKLLADLDDLRKAGMKEKEESLQEIARLDAIRKDFEKKIGHANIEIERYVTANAELAAISRELLEKYRNKGVVSAIAAKEPLTQVNKVKLEEYVQEYSDKIESLKIEKKK